MIGFQCELLGSSFPCVHFRCDGDWFGLIYVNIYVRNKSQFVWNVLHWFDICVILDHQISGGTVHGFQLMASIKSFSII